MSYSRPSTSQGSFAILPRRQSVSRPTSPEKRVVPQSSMLGTPLRTPGQRAVSSCVPRSLPPTHPRLNGVTNTTPSKPGPQKASQRPQENGHVGNAASVPGLRGSRTLAAKPPRSRQPIGNVFDTGEDASSASNPISMGGAQPKKKRIPGTKVSEKKLGEVPCLDTQPSEGATPPKSSAALRETIARAKAAHRTASKTQEATPEVLDDFAQMDVGGSNHAVICKRLDTARKEGRLNIAALGLKEVPREILRMYDTDNLDVNDGSWAESVDVVKFIAADNEISSLDDELFPQLNISGPDEQGSSVLAGLETMDLHGNLLSILPGALAGLVNLTTLNLSRNRLDNQCLHVIGNIRCLRDLRLGDNSIKGDLNRVICRLTSLEHLDISRNTISLLPPEIRELRALHTLSLSGNKLQNLPMEALASMPLRNLDASRNCLKGALFPLECGGLFELKGLDVSFNALTSITEQSLLELPNLQALNVSENRLKSLPHFTGLPVLITLTAEGNQISAVPEGIIDLPNLKNVELSRNDIRQFDERIGFMDSLSVFRIANNPLRERRLLNLNTEDLLQELRSRHDKANGLKSTDEADDVSNPFAPGTIKGSSSWLVQPGGVLDLSSAGLHSIEWDQLERLDGQDSIKSLGLQHNTLTKVPQSIGMVAHTLLSLDLSHNKLIGEAYLPDRLELPKLKTLCLSANVLSSLLPLMATLSARALSELDVSRNRLNSLPVLREAFPRLTSLKAADNQITDLPVDVVRGLQVLNVSGNAINFLDPKIGLLGQEGLRTLLVGANTFRVPRRDVVEKGTEAILTWLKGRIADE